MTWAERTITDAGLILLQEALDGKAFTVVFAAAGTGYKEPMQLASQTAIEEQISGLDCKIVENNYLSSGPGREIVVQITNSGITEATRIKQVGIYAKTDGTPVLFAVVQDSDGCIVPAEGYIGGYKLRLKFGVPISATEKITVITTPEGTASKDELENSIRAHNADPNAHADIISRIDEKISNLLTKHIVATRERDPSKPDYGIGGSDEISAVLEVGTYTGTAATTVVVSGVEYDANNLSHSGESVPDGNIIFNTEV